MDNYIIGVFVIAILLVGYAHDVRDGRDDALYQLATRTVITILTGLFSYVSNRKRAAS